MAVKGPGARRKRYGFGLSRRDFLRASVAVPTAGALYFGYQQLQTGPVKLALIGGGQHVQENIIPALPTDYVNVVALFEPRPSQQTAAQSALAKKLTPKGAEQVAIQPDWETILNDPNVEAVYIATPPHTHAKYCIEALERGKHVLCDAVLAANTADAKAIVRAAAKAEQKKTIFAVAQERNFNIRYEEGRREFAAGTLGTVKFIQMYHHHNHTLGDPLETLSVPEEDASVDAKKLGFESVEQLVNWRTNPAFSGGFLPQMGLGSLNTMRQFLMPTTKDQPLPLQTMPIALQAIGTNSLPGGLGFDHSYCIYEFPNGVNVMFTIITTNRSEGVSEVFLGTDRTLMINNEQEWITYDEPLSGKSSKRWDEYLKSLDAKADPTSTKMKVDVDTSMYTSASVGYSAEAASAKTGYVSPGHQEAMEYFAFCVRHHLHPDRSDAQSGLTNLVLAQAAQVSMQQKQRLEFKSEWFDPNARESTPDPLPGDKTWLARA